jgi:HdeA/HdeB family
MVKITTLAAVALLASLTTACAQTAVPLTTYADADGYIDVQTLSCAQLAGTYQEDADALAMWYSGWYNGLAKRHYFNLPRSKEGLHQVILYCKANKDKKVIEAIAVVLKNEKK